MCRSTWTTPKPPFNKSNAQWAEDRYTQSIKAIQEAKTRVLDDYNLFNLITEHFDRLSLTNDTAEKPFVAYPSKWFRKGPLYRLKFKIQQMMK